MERIEADLRSAQVLAALRLAVLHALVPSSRLATGAGRGGALRIAGGHVRLPTTTQWRERNPWLAFEDGFRTVRGFVQHLEGGALGPLQARLGEDLQALAEGSATAVLAVASPSALRALSDSTGPERSGMAPRIRLVLGQPPMRPSLDRLGVAYHGTAWTLGREAASLLPIDALADPSLRAPWSWQAVTVGRALAAVEPSMARDGRVVQLVDGGAEALAAVAIGAASAGYRVVVARRSDPDDAGAGVIELLPPGAVMPPGPRSRANVALPSVGDGPGDPERVPGPGLFAPPERFDQRPFSATDAAKVVTDAAVDTLRARGEPARMERLFGEILVGLDRSGHLRRLATGPRPSTGPTPPEEPTLSPPSLGGGSGSPPRLARAEVADGASEGGPPVAVKRATAEDATPDPVERLLALIRESSAARASGGSPRSSPAAGGSPSRRTGMRPPRHWPIAWSGPCTACSRPRDRSRRPRSTIGSRRCSPGTTCPTRRWSAPAWTATGAWPAPRTAWSPPTTSCIEARSTPSCWPRSRRPGIASGCGSGWPSASRRVATGAGTSATSSTIASGARTSGASVGRSMRCRQVDAIWYIRGKVALLFEVEWTAMLGEPLLRRHARIGSEDRFIRFLAIAPERTDLVRHKLDRSPLLRSAIEEQSWNIIKWDHLRSFLAADKPDLDDLEPLLGLDPVVERGGEQMHLFGG